MPRTQTPARCVMARAGVFVSRESDVNFWEHQPDTWINLDRAKHVIYKRDSIAPDPNAVPSFLGTAQPTVTHQLKLEFLDGDQIVVEGPAKIADLAATLGIRDPISTLPAGVSPQDGPSP